MDTNTLKRILQKAEGYQKGTNAPSAQTDETLLERIRQRAEEKETLKKRTLDWHDNIQAIQETYGLSQKEMTTILQEVEKEKQNASTPKRPQKTFLEKFFPLFFSPKGRIGRGTFLVSILALLVFQGAMGRFALQGILPFGVLTLVGFYANIMLCIKRFHDLGKSGLFALLTLVPVLNFFTYLYLLFFKGTKGPNSFGEEP